MHASGILEVNSPLTICLDIPQHARPELETHSTSSHSSVPSPKNVHTSIDSSVGTDTARSIGSSLVRLLTEPETASIESIRVQAFARLPIGARSLRLGSQDGRSHYHLDGEQRDAAARIASRFHLSGCYMKIGKGITHTYSIASHGVIECSRAHPPIERSACATWEDMHKQILREGRHFPPVKGDPVQWLKSIGYDETELEQVAATKPSFSDELELVETNDDDHHGTSKALSSRLGSLRPRWVPAALSEVLSKTVDLAMPVPPNGATHSTSTKEIDGPCFCPLPFDVELHQLEGGQRFLLDTHRLLAPDSVWIAKCKVDPTFAPRI